MGNGYGFSGGADNRSFRSFWSVCTVYPLPCREIEIPLLDGYYYIRGKSSASERSSFKFLGDVVGLCTSLLEDLVIVAAVFL
jgi:hypothetical protein